SSRGEITFHFVGVFVEEVNRDNHLEDGVAQKFQSFVTLSNTWFVETGTVSERDLEKFLILKGVA
ncbi:MAG: hypothetical protein UV37_C0028G0004, partial [Candidatus Collierbacteria bacterium GW2011_GWA1_42_60]